MPHARARVHRSAGKQALREVRKLKSKISVEKKAFFQNLPAIPALTAAICTHVTAVAQGDDFDERDGNMIKLTSVSLKGQLLGGGGGTSLVRIVLFRDNDNQGAPAAITDLWNNSTAYSQNDHRLVAPNPQRRFTILADKSYRVGSATVNDNFNVPFSISRKVTNKCYFTGTASSDEGKGSIWMIIGSNLASNLPTVVGTMKCTYTDS